MRFAIVSLAALGLIACNRAEAPADNAVEANASATADAKAAEATPAAFEIKGTSWEFTRDGKATKESIDEAGTYVATVDGKEIDRGTAVMKEDKACFTSAVDKEGELCWTTQPLEIGQSMETTSDKGEKLTVKRVPYVAPAAPAAAQ